MTVITKWIARLVAGSLLLAARADALPPVAVETHPTVVLVHGAFAESASWNGVISELQGDGYTVVAVANPLRGVSRDASYLASILAALPGRLVLVGHSYGGAVITNAVDGRADVKALVFVAGLAPDAGESAAQLTGRFPGSTLGPTLAPAVTLPDGSKELSILQDRFPAQVAADLPLAEAQQMAAAQRPIVQSAFAELSGPPAWKRVPSWFIYGALDHNIPPALQEFMAKRAQAKQVVAVAGASHVVMISHPHEVVAMIEAAASAR